METIKTDKTKTKVAIETEVELRGCWKWPQAIHVCFQPLSFSWVHGAHLLCREHDSVVRAGSPFLAFSPHSLSYARDTRIKQACWTNLQKLLYVFPQFTQSPQSRSGWARFPLHSAAPSCRRARCPSAPTAPAKVPLSHLRRREGAWLSLRFEAVMLIVNFCWVCTLGKVTISAC